MLRRRKLLGVCARRRRRQSPASGARFVGQVWLEQDSLPKCQNHRHTDLILHAIKLLAMLALLKLKFGRHKNAKSLF